jgi:hypothetical protein
VIRRRSSERLTIVLSGMLAGVPRQGGASWAVLQYLLGLRRLGHDVVFVEPVSKRSGELASSPAAAYFRDLVDAFDLSGSAALIDAAGGDSVGLTRRQLLAVADDADLLLNISGC